MRFRLTLALAVLASLAMTASPSFAQPTTWQNIGNDWGTASNWSSGVPNSATSIAICGPQAAPVQPNIASVFTVQQTTFDNTLAPWNLTGTGTNLLRVGSGGILWFGGGASQMSANLQIALNQVWDVGTTNVTVGGTPVVGALFGLSGLTKAGVGTLILDSGTGLFTGGFNVTNGVLQSGSATNNAASQALRSNSVTLGGGTSLTTVGVTIDLRVGDLNGSGSVTPAVGGAINVLALNNGSFSGAITTTGGLNLRGGNGTTQIFNGNLTALTGTVAFNSGASLVLSGTGDSTSGVLAATTIASRGGSLVLDNTGGNTLAATGRLADAAATTLLGGTLSLLGDGAGTIETLGTIALNAGAATVSVTHNGGAGTALAFTDAGAIRDSTAMTVNFVGNGGTLGTAGANPRVTFSGVLFTGTNTGMLANSAGSDTTIGWATATTGGDTNWAGFNAVTGIIPLANVLRDETTINGGVAFERTLYAPTANGTLTAPLTIGALKIQPTAPGLSLAMGANAISTTGLLFTGTNDFAITSTGGALFGAVSGTRYVHVIDANATLSVNASFAGANQPFNKSGAGFLDLNGAANQIAFTSAQSINILQGVLRGTATSLGGFTAAGGAFTNINLYGGTLELSGGGTFVRALDLTGTAAGGTIRIDSGGTTRGDAGLSAINGDMAVTFVTAIGGATPNNLVWDDGLFLSNGYSLMFGSSKSDSRIELTNNIGLDTGVATASYFGREVRVANNVSSLNDVARLSGQITGSSNADLLKTGPGTLELTGNANNYAGNTQVLQGTLRANNVSGSATGTGNVLVRSGATLGGSGFVVPNNAGGNQVAIAGTVAPGNSVGALTIGSGLSPATVTATGSYDFELSTVGSPAAADTGGSSVLGVHDAVTIFGSLDVSSLVINPISLGVTGFNNTQSYSWTVATATGGVTGTPGIVSLGSGIDFAGMSFLASVVGNNVYLNFTPVPEPATVLSIAAIGFGVGGLIRRRFRKSPAA